MRFTKMHGLGNDYVYVDGAAETIVDPAELARRISDRHTGVGGDGLIVLHPSRVADIRMEMYNADGSRGLMCGNGIRCVAKFVYDHGLARRNPLTIESAGQIYSLELNLEGGSVASVRVDMGEPILTPAAIPTNLRSPRGPEEPVVGVPINIAGRTFDVTTVSMGNPHCVTFVDSATDDWVLDVGPKLEVDSQFPKRVNCEFVEVLGCNELRQRTWERGSGETHACGTGACAVCVAGVLTGRSDRKVVIHLLGGDLSIEWNAENNHVYMTGPAVEVFNGNWLG
jgi:diaminopimelate epimerase